MKLYSCSKKKYSNFKPIIKNILLIKQYIHNKLSFLITVKILYPNKSVRRLHDPKMILIALNHTVFTWNF